MNGMFCCPICGANLESEYILGEICLCCGNESGFSDDIDKEDIDKSKYFKVLEKKHELEDQNKPVPQEIMDYLKSTIYSTEEAYEILRDKWIKEGCTWNLNDNNEKPSDWGLDKAREQLKNINVNLEKY